MSSELACPRCKHRLRVSGDADSRWLTCPRCLASVRNPRFNGEPNPVLDAAPLRVVQPEPLTACPACGRPTEATWRFCPHCEQPLRAGLRSAGRRVRLPDEDEHYDSQGLNVGLMVLGILLVLGVGLFLVSGGLGLVLNVRNGATVLILGGVVGAVFLGGVLAIRAGASNQRVKSVTQMLGCFVAGAGAACLVIFATCIGLLNGCARGFH
jgi:hypothetical protein